MENMDFSAKREASISVTLGSIWIEPPTPLVSASAMRAMGRVDHERFEVRVISHPSDMIVRLGGVADEKLISLTVISPVTIW